MLAKLNTFALVGIDAVPVEVEVDVSGGTAKTVIVGLPEMGVRESVFRPVKGALSMAMAARDHKLTRILVPAANAREACVVEEVATFGVNTLGDAVGILNGEITVEPMRAGIDELFAQLNTYEVDFGD